MGHHHDHHHGTKNIKGAFFLNLIFTVIEIIGGFMTNSMAILSDALHDLGDSISLGLAWFMENYSMKGRDRKFTYGYGRFSLLAALINSLVLVTGSVLILVNAVPKIMDPGQPNVQGMLWLSILGMVFNGAAVLRLKGGTSINEKVVRLHLLEDVLGWVAVFVVSIVMMIYELPVLDPLLSVAIACYILFNVVKNLYQTGRIFLQAIPGDVNVEEVSGRMQELKGVEGVHDIHVWSLDGEFTVMTVHVVMANDTSLSEALQLKRTIRRLVRKQHIEHVTIELEYQQEECDLEEC